MIVAFLNQKGGAGKTTLALNLAGEWARRGLRMVHLVVRRAVSAPSPSPPRHARD